MKIRGVRLTLRTALNGEREKKAADLLAAQMTPTLTGFPRSPLRRISSSAASESARWWRLSAASHSSAALLKKRRGRTLMKAGKNRPVDKKAPLKSRMICCQPAWFSATVSGYAGWPHPNASISLVHADIPSLWPLSNKSLCELNGSANHGRFFFFFSFPPPLYWLSQTTGVKAALITLINLLFN